MPAGFWHDEHGRGPAVVLVHAGIADSRMWEPQLRSFAAHYRVVRIDLRGFGRSPYPPGRWSPVDDLRELLDELGIERAAFVGASYGASIALDLAIAYPERVWALVLAGGSVRGRPWGEEVQRYGADEEAALAAGDLDGAAELNVRFWVDGRRPPGAAPEDARRLVAAMQLRAFELEGEAEGLEPEPQPVAPLWATEPRLGEIEAPTLAVVGEADVADVLATAELLVSRIPDCRMALVRDAAHLPSLERPDEFDALVLPFLAEAARRDRPASGPRS